MRLGRTNNITVPPDTSEQNNRLNISPKELPQNWDGNTKLS